MDSYIQVAHDNPEGKQVDMDQVATAAGPVLYRQRAVLVGETGNILQQMLLVMLQQLAVSRALLAIHLVDHPGSLGEEDFMQDLTPNDN